MNENPELFENEPVSDRPLVKSAMVDGTHEAIATLTKYAVIGGVVFGLGYLFLPKKTTRSLKEKYL